MFSETLFIVVGVVLVILAANTCFPFIIMANDLQDFFYNQLGSCCRNQEYERLSYPPEFILASKSMPAISYKLRQFDITPSHVSQLAEAWNVSTQFIESIPNREHYKYSNDFLEYAVDVLELYGALEMDVLQIGRAFKFVVDFMPSEEYRQDLLLRVSHHLAGSQTEFDVSIHQLSLVLALLHNECLIDEEQPEEEEGEEDKEKMCKELLLSVPPPENRYRKPLYQRMTNKLFPTWSNDRIEQEIQASNFNIADVVIAAWDGSEVVGNVIRRYKRDTLPHIQTDNEISAYEFEKAWALGSHHTDKLIDNLDMGHIGRIVWIFTHMLFTKQRNYNNANGGDSNVATFLT